MISEEPIKVFNVTLKDTNKVVQVYSLNFEGNAGIGLGLDGEFKILRDENIALVEEDTLKDPILNSLFVKYRHLEAINLEIQEKVAEKGYLIDSKKLSEEDTQKTYDELGKILEEFSENNSKKICILNELQELHNKNLN